MFSYFCFGRLYEGDEMTTEHLYVELSFSVVLLDFAIIAAPV